MQKKIVKVSPAAFGHLMLEFEDGLMELVHRRDHNAALRYHWANDSHSHLCRCQMKKRHGAREAAPAGTSDGGTQGGPQRRRGAVRLAAEIEVPQPHSESAPGLQEALVTTNCRQTAPIPQTGRTPPAIQHQPRSRLVPGTACGDGARKA